MTSYIVLSLGIFFNALASILLKAGMERLMRSDFHWVSFSASFPKLLFNPFFILGLISFGCAFFAYTYSLSRIPLNIAYPLFVSVGVLVVVGASVFLFRESFHSLQILGVLFIILGIWFLTFFR